MTVLDQIVQSLQADLAKREQSTGIDQLKRLARRQDPPRDAVQALRTEGAVTVIGELKRRDMLGRPIAEVKDVAQFATALEKGGATIISVVTERRYSGGSLSDLRQVRQAVNLPVLYKEFVISPYQIHEARAYGADMVLLLVATLEQNVLTSLIERVHSLGMAALVEAHSRLEALRAMEAGAQVVGVNAQNLRTLALNMENFAQIVDVIPESVVAVAESGVVGPHDVFNYAQQGADAVLIGTALMQASDPQSTVRAMVAAGAHPALASSRKRRVKTFDQIRRRTGS